MEEDSLFAAQVEEPLAAGCGLGPWTNSWVRNSSWDRERSCGI